MKREKKNTRYTMFDFKSLLNDIFMRKKLSLQNLFTATGSLKTEKMIRWYTTLTKSLCCYLIILFQCTPLQGGFSVPKKNIMSMFLHIFFNCICTATHSRMCCFVSSWIWRFLWVFCCAVRVYLIHNLLSGSFKINQDLRKCVRLFFPREFFAGI